MYHYFRDSQRAKGFGRKDYRQSMCFHKMVCNAREHGLPKKIAWAASAFITISMSIWSYIIIRDPQIPVVIILFLIYGLIFRLVSGFVFFILDFASRRVYRKSDFYQEDNHYSSYKFTDFKDPDDAFKTARTMFHLSETFSHDELKKARNQIITENKLHPDDGGDAAKFRELMRTYDFLEKYCTR